ncbi:hypothetical protein PG994_003370 [Apiospora phragmitis]|uniref:Uncharacterized protein n=1 Tax=Apiospora phragmitis TaxID=2905665 RepID=A0ABR1W1V9_9PEZI
MSLEAPLEADESELLEKGYLDLNIQDAGRLVGEVVKGNLLSSPGLDFLNRILHNPRIERIAKSLLGPCKLGHWLKYNAWPGYIEGWRTGGKEAGLRILLGSHLHDLPLLDGVRNRGLPQTTRAALEDAGCIAVERDYPNGAMIILDARLFRTIDRGNVIKHALVATDALGGWPKLKVEESLQKKIEETQSTIEINYEIIDKDIA